MLTAGGYTLQDHQDLEQLFRAYYRRLSNVAFRILNDENLAEDVVQEVFLKLWEKRASISVTTTIEGYLIRSVTNHALNQLEKQKRIKSVDADLSQAIASQRADQPMNYEELRKIVYAALDRLPPRCRTIFMLSRFEDMKYREIAEHLNISVKTVENQMSIAIDKLSKELKPSLKYDFISVMFLLGCLDVFFMDHV